MKSLVVVLPNGVGMESFLAWFYFGDVQTLVGPLCLPVPLQQRNARAPNWNGDVGLRVGMTATDTRARATQDHRWHVDRSAAKSLALMAVGTHQASFTQTVSFRDVTGVPRWVVGYPILKYKIKLERWQYYSGVSAQIYACITLALS